MLRTDLRWWLPVASGGPQRSSKEPERPIENLRVKAAEEEPAEPAVSLEQLRMRSYGKML